MTDATSKRPRKATTTDKRPAAVPDKLRQKVLELRRTQSTREVAEATGLPLGTVKTICTRSGTFRDNAALREFFSLPPMRPSASTTLSVPAMPEMVDRTGDKDLNAVLWLREVIETGEPALIEKALQAAKLITTSADELEKRYTDFLVLQDRLTNGGRGGWVAVFKSFDFANLEGMAKTTLDKKARQREAHARLGDTVADVFDKLPTETFCIECLAGLKLKKGAWQYEPEPTDKRFNARADMRPHTLDDCLYELKYWNDLYHLRCAFPNSGDHWQEVSAREDYLFRCMALIRPRTKNEAVEVLHYLADDRMDRKGADAILLNLVSGR